MNISSPSWQIIENPILPSLKRAQTDKPLICSHQSVSITALLKDDARVNMLESCRIWKTEWNLIISVLIYRLHNSGYRINTQLSKQQLLQGGQGGQRGHGGQGSQGARETRGAKEAKEARGARGIFSSSVFNSSLLSLQTAEIHPLLSAGGQVPGGDTFRDLKSWFRGSSCSSSIISMDVTAATRNCFFFFFFTLSTTIASS